MDPFLGQSEDQMDAFILNHHYSFYMQNGRLSRKALHLFR